jgi:LacI family transcriptional regulator
MQSLRRAGLAPDAALIWQGNLKADDLAAMCSEGLSYNATRPDAILCTNGPTALGVLRGLRDRGLKTPDDIGFVTFDELTVDDLFSPAITAIVQPAYEIGSRAADILLDRIENRASGDAVSTLRLPATLKIRESSRPASHRVAI